MVIELNVTNQSIQDLNEIMKGSTKGRETVNGLINLLAGVLSKSAPSEVQVTTRDSSASISTSGAGSQQQNYNLK